MILTNFDDNIDKSIQLEKEIKNLINKYKCKGGSLSTSFTGAIEQVHLTLRRDLIVKY